MLQAKITLVKTKAPNSTQQTSNPFWLGKQLNKQKIVLAVRSLLLTSNVLHKHVSLARGQMSLSPLHF